MTKLTPVVEPLRPTLSHPISKEPCYPVHFVFWRASWCGEEGFVFVASRVLAVNDRGTEYMLERIDTASPWERTYQSAPLSRMHDNWRSSRQSALDMWIREHERLTPRPDTDRVLALARELHREMTHDRSVPTSA